MDVQGMKLAAAPLVIRLIGQTLSRSLESVCRSIRPLLPRFITEALPFPLLGHHRITDRSSVRSEDTMPAIKIPVVIIVAFRAHIEGSFGWTEICAPVFGVAGDATHSGVCVSGNPCQ